MLRSVGAKDNTEILFPQYMTSIAPRIMEGLATPIRTPAAHETTTIERLMAERFIALCSEIENFDEYV